LHAGQNRSILIIAFANLLFGHRRAQMQSGHTRQIVASMLVIIFI